MMDYYSLLGVILLLLVLYISYRYIYAPYQIFKRCGIKGPTPTPFYGNYSQIKKQGILAFEKSIFNEFGDVCGYYIGKQPFLLVADPDMIKEITVKQFQYFTNRLKLPNFSKLHTPKGLIFLQDQEWKTKRQIISPTFSTAKMKLMVPHIENSVKTLVGIVGDNADTGKSFDFFRMFGSFTMETILAIAYGREIDVQKGEGNSFTKAASALVKQLGEIFFLIFLMSNFPWLDPIIAYFTKPNMSFRLLYSSTLTLINTRREEGSKCKDLLQLMMDATGGEEVEKNKKEVVEEAACPIRSSSIRGKKFTDDDIGNLASGFLLAGYETTANTLNFTTYLLALHPHIQEKLQREIDGYYEDNPEASLFEASSAIAYLDMVIMESVRLYSVASQLNRVCNKTTTIKGVLIPKDTMVVIPVHLLHSDARFWQNPDEFDPLRFSPEEKAKRPQLCHIPFGFGPRNCIGKRFVLLEAKITLIELLKRFTFLKAPDTEVPLKTQYGLTLSPANGTYLRVTKRGIH